MNILVLIFSGWLSFIPPFKISLFLSNYLNCLIYPVLYFSCKAWFKDQVIPLDAIDFHTEFTLIDTEVHEPTGKSTYDRALNTIF
jgi:amino acid transporter